MADMLDIAAPLLLIIVAIAAVAVLYFVATALRDRCDRRREEELAARARAGQKRPRRTDGRGAHMR